MYNQDSFISALLKKKTPRYENRGAKSLFQGFLMVCGSRQTHRGRLLLLPQSITNGGYH